MYVAWVRTCSSLSGPQELGETMSDEELLEMIREADKDEDQEAGTRAGSGS